MHLPSPLDSPEGNQQLNAPRHSSSAINCPAPPSTEPLEQFFFFYCMVEAPELHFFFPFITFNNNNNNREQQWSGAGRVEGVWWNPDENHTAKRNRFFIQRWTLSEEDDEEEEITSLVKNMHINTSANKIFNSMFMLLQVLLRTPTTCLIVRLQFILATQNNKPRFSCRVRAADSLR